LIPMPALKIEFFSYLYSRPHLGAFTGGRLSLDTTSSKHLSFCSFGLKFVWPSKGLPNPLPVPSARSLIGLPERILNALVFPFFFSRGSIFLSFTRLKFTASCALPIAESAYWVNRFYASEAEILKTGSFISIRCTRIFACGSTSLINRFSQSNLHSLFCSIIDSFEFGFHGEFPLSRV
jgi:hypothetical protein